MELCIIYNTITITYGTFSPHLKSHTGKHTFLQICTLKILFHPKTLNSMVSWLKKQCVPRLKRIESLSYKTASRQEGTCLQRMQIFSDLSLEGDTTTTTITEGKAELLLIWWPLTLLQRTDRSAPELSPMGQTSSEAWPVVGVWTQHSHGWHSAHSTRHSSHIAASFQWDPESMVSEDPDLL